MLYYILILGFTLIAVTNAAGYSMRLFNLLGDNCANGVPFSFSTTTSAWASSFCSAWETNFLQNTALKSSLALSASYGCLPANSYNYTDASTNRQISYSEVTLASCYNFPFVSTGAPNEYHGMDSYWAFFSFYYNSPTCNITQSASLASSNNYAYANNTYTPYGMINAFSANGVCSPSASTRTVPWSATPVAEYRKFSCDVPSETSSASNSVTITLCTDPGCRVNCTSITVSANNLNNCVSLQDRLGNSSESILAASSTISDTNDTLIFFSAACLKPGDNPTYSNFQTYQSQSSSSAVSLSAASCMSIVILISLFICFI